MLPIIIEISFYKFWQSTVAKSRRAVKSIFLPTATTYCQLIIQSMFRNSIPFQNSYYAGRQVGKIIV